MIKKYLNHDKPLPHCDVLSENKLPKANVYAVFIHANIVMSTDRMINIPSNVVAGFGVAAGLVLCLLITLCAMYVICVLLHLTMHLCDHYHVFFTIDTFLYPK